MVVVSILFSTIISAQVKHFTAYKTLVYNMKNITLFRKKIVCLS